MVERQGSDDCTDLGREFMTMEKEQMMQEWKHVQMNQKMFHHHHDHVKCDRVQGDQEQKLYVHII